MRCMVFVKASKESEAGILPSTETPHQHGQVQRRTRQSRRNARWRRPQAQLRRQARHLHCGAKPTITDGPFAETKELVAGFWIWQVRSIEEAVEWLKRSPFGPGAEVEIRPVFEAEDFGANLTPELKEREERLREQISAKK